MSKVAKRNFVKKHMHKFHREKVHTSGKLYDRIKEKQYTEGEINDELEDQLERISVRQGLHW